MAQAPSEQALMVKPTFHASLSGRDAGTGSQGTGEAWFRFSEDGTEVEFRLNVANITNVTMAHIHVAAAPGLNGPPAVWLYPAAPPPAGRYWCRRCKPGSARRRASVPAPG